MNTTDDILERIRKEFSKQKVEDRQPTGKQIVEGLVGDIHEELKRGNRLDAIYKTIRGKIPPEIPLTLSTFKKYWHECRSAAGLQRVKNSGRSRADKNIFQKNRPNIAPSHNSDTILTPVRHRINTSDDFREDPDDI